MKIDIPKYIIHASQNLRSNLSCKIKRSGYTITSEQWKVLSTIDEYKVITQVQLGTFLDKAPPAISKIIAKLHKLKLVNIINNEDDRREKKIELSTDGNGIINDLNSIASNHHRVAFKGVSAAEKKELKKILTKIILNLENSDEKV